MSYEGAEPFDLSKTFVHLGLGASTVELPGFKFSADYLRKYLVRFVKDRDEGRLVGMLPMQKTWTHWEQHVHGDELVVVLTGRCDVVQELADGSLHRLGLGPGEAMINPRGVWHTTDVHEPGSQLFIAAGRQTVYRPRE
jgi:uncharacterized cupin superfamily protein